MLVDEETGVDLILERWHQSTSLQKQQGRTWYLSAHDFALSLSFRFSVPLSTSAGVIAALSPKNKWKDNQKDAELVLELESTGQRQSITRDKFSSTYPKVSNVLNILNGINPDNTLGQKAKSFYRCIYNPMTNEVCVDTWAAKIVNYRERWVSRTDYPIIQTYYQIAAETVGTLPPIMQATTWIQIRGKND